MKKVMTVDTDRNVFKSYFEGIKRYCQLKGRTSRYDYWSFVLINFIVGCVLGYMEGIQGKPAALSGAYSIFMLLPSVAIQVRRLHDINKSGWWIGGLLLFFTCASVAQGIWEYNGHVTNDAYTATISIITCVWAFVLLFFYIRKGDAEDNRYGEPQA